MNNVKITVQLYADEYKEDNLVKSILNKKFGFELNFENAFERNRRILSLEQVKQLYSLIEEALQSYDDVITHNFDK